MKETTADIRDTHKLLQVFKVALSHQLVALGNNLKSNPDQAYETKWNQTYQVDIAKTAKMHALYITSLGFIEGIQKLAADSKTTEVLSSLCDLFISDAIVNHGECALEYHYVNSKQMMNIVDYRSELIEGLRPHMVALIETPVHHDGLIHCETLAGFDTDYATELYKNASLTPLNRKTKLDSHDECIVPLTKKMSAKL
jgi:hypothetical protein